MTEHEIDVQRIVPVELTPGLNKTHYRSSANDALTIVSLRHELRRQKEQNQQAAYDTLTGLRLRYQFEEDARRLHQRTVKSGHSVAMLFADANRLKKINDEEGHAAGDIYLKIIANELRKILRASDITGRVGGDEFAAVIGLEESLDAKALHELGVDIKQRLNQSVKDSVGIENAVSMGVVPWDYYQDLNEVLGLADKAMYTDKRSLQAYRPQYPIE